jgi:hypothetical protein
MDEDESRPPLGGLIILFVGAAFIVVGAAFLTYGLYALIRTGVWPHYPASQMIAEIGFGYPQIGWSGGQRAIDWVLSSSACVVLLSIGAIIASLGVWRITRHSKKRRLAAAEAEAAAV